MDETRRQWVTGLVQRFAALGIVGMIAVAAVPLFFVIALSLGYVQTVVRNPGPHLERDAVRGIIAQESPVYFRDGTTRVGVFFEAEHRQFVPFGDLPRAYVMGIVASEDSRFWSHGGLDPKGIVRAMRDNLRAGGVVAGGSTLTQQTAKNLYYRPDRSLRSKGAELLNALRLESHYSKAEILEFYANQFHVSGNGRGLGIAARHFFDEEVEELTVAECAFLAGLVKAPSRYDPFLGDAARRERSVAAAHERTRHVLRRILDETADTLAGPMPDGSSAQEQAYAGRTKEAAAVQAEAAALLEDGFTLPFRRGSFRFESSAVLDEVARRLAEPPFDDLLRKAGVEDEGTAGLVVVTTLDVDAQREATWALWHHLTEAGAWLESLGPDAFVLKGHRGPRFDPDFPPRAHEFRAARVVSHDGAAGARTLTLDLGGHACEVDRSGVVRAAVASYRGKKKDGRAKAPSAEVDAWLAAIPDEAVVLASVRDVRDGRARCDLEVRPELQGAVTVLQEGQIRAMVGGNDNRNFNRAAALRQFGSVWKPLVFHAAMQLGWSPDDVLDNSRNVFPFSTTYYYPRPDHTPASQVSLSWAGVNSENLASIWLLYHLADRLDGAELSELAESLDLAKRGAETDKEYRTRIQRAGVLPTRDRVAEGLYLQARQEVLSGITSSPHPEDAIPLQSLLYGWGYASERNRVEREPARERAWKSRALDNNWRALQSRLSSCRFQHGVLVDAVDARVAPDPARVPDLSVLVDGDAVRVACGALPEAYVLPDAEFMATLSLPAVPAPQSAVLQPAAPAPRRRGAFSGATRPERPAETQLAWPRLGRREGPTVQPIGDMRIDDRLHFSTLEAISGALERSTLAVELQPEPPDLYDPEVLYWHQDFRVLLAIRYVASLAEQYGVQTDIREVLSMPLGASEITLEEAASMYTGLVSGTAWEFPGVSGGERVAPLPTSTLLIQEIRDVDGHVLYRAVPRPTVVAESSVADMTGDILRNVVLHGTGRRAKHALVHGGQALPVGGKTGTTNDFRNAAFLGFAPVAVPEGYTNVGGFVVGAYVGYDDNRSMVQGKIRLAGASGALPAWMGTVQGLANSGLLGSAPEAPTEPDAGWPLLVDSALARAAADPSTGLAPPPEGSDASILVRHVRRVRPPEVVFRPLERPPRISPRTEDALKMKKNQRAPAGRGRRRQPR